MSAYQSSVAPHNPRLYLDVQEQGLLLESRLDPPCLSEDAWLTAGPLPEAYRVDFPYVLSVYIRPMCNER